VNGRGPRAIQIWRYLTLLSVVVLWSHTAEAVCPASPAEPIETIAAKLESLENRLREFPADQINGPRHRALQEQALAELENLQCTTESLAPDEELQRGPNIDSPFVEVPILFVTDRDLLAVPDGEHRFFGRRRNQGGLSFGNITVSMPAERYQEGTPMPVQLGVLR
jgi:hypothetical protein